MNSQIRLTLIAFFSYMVMSGLLTQAGVILNAIAGQLAMPPSQAVSVFSWLTGGALVGTFISMYLYTRFTLRALLLVTYVMLILFSVVLQLVPVASYPLLATIFLGLGVCCGCGLSGGAVIISRIYRAQRRASAFIATDCAFSAAGFIFPTLAGWLLASGIDWTLSYLAVAGLAVVILLLALTSVFPSAQHATDSAEQEQSTEHRESALVQFKRILTPRVICFAAGVCLYLIAQTTFLTWAPNYLMAYFGAAQAEAGQVVGNYWGFSIFGLLASVVLVNFIPTRVMLLVVSMLAIGFTALFIVIESTSAFLTLGLAFGLLTTCIYKIAISVGTQQVADSPPMLVTLMLFSGSIGSTLAPVISGTVVERTNEKGAMLLSLGCFGLMMLLFVIAMWIERQRNRQVTPGSNEPKVNPV